MAKDPELLVTVSWENGCMCTRFKSVADDAIIKCYNSLGIYSLIYQVDVMHVQMIDIYAKDVCMQVCMDMYMGVWYGIDEDD